MAFCESEDIEYVLELARNSRLEQRISKDLQVAHVGHLRTGKPARVFADFRWSPGQPESSPCLLAGSTKRSTALVATWRTESKSSSSTCLLTGRAPGQHSVDHGLRGGQRTRGSPKTVTSLPVVRDRG